ncbi:ABC transporter substrate-binding protein [Myxacorys almedinensis]|uniref:ABC transporter substrate-binding protein n=1 Tax=Myxacorys almedinensis A TaxID=2690445 RepID=A0A8J7ZBD4_9CYAN|nr:ABC transporter substrate-binding protein [Myxacorys almedinensis]NDJ19828.1 ABC transporter substrate-binding protein [Myxacorys almedinensis A]
MPPETSHLLKDNTGVEIIWSQPANRIVCLTATGLDILLELDLTPVGYTSQTIATKPEFYGDRTQQLTPVGSWFAPNLKTIRNLQPDLILGWSFPHRFYQRWLRKIAPVYLMDGSGYEMAFKRLRQIAQLTERVAEAEAAIALLENRLTVYCSTVPVYERKTVLMMGGSSLNRLTRKFIVESNAGTFGSVLKQCTHYPWAEPTTRHEPGFTSLSLQQILDVNPDVIFVQTYAPSTAPLSQQLANNLIWKQIKAVQHDQVYEIEQFWHTGNGTRTIGLMLDQLVPKIYPTLC